MFIVHGKSGLWRVLNSRFFQFTVPLRSWNFNISDKRMMLEGRLITFNKQWDRSILLLLYTVIE
jgi:hypothetical protein